MAHFNEFVFGGVEQVVSVLVVQKLFRNEMKQKVIWRTFHFPDKTQLLLFESIKFPLKIGQKYKLKLST